MRGNPIWIDRIRSADRHLSASTRGTLRWPAEIVRSGGLSLNICARDFRVRLTSECPSRRGPRECNRLYSTCLISNGRPSASASAITWLLSPARAPSSAQMRSGAFSLSVVNSVPRREQGSHRMCSALDSVADLAGDRKLHGADQPVSPEKVPEVREIGQAPPSEWPLEEPLSDQPPERSFDRDDSDWPAGQYRLGNHRDAVGGDVNFIGFFQEHREAGEILNDLSNCAPDRP